MEREKERKAKYQGEEKGRKREKGKLALVEGGRQLLPQIGSISYSMLFFEFEFFADGPFTFRLVWTGLDLLKKEIKNLTAATSS